MIGGSFAKAIRSGGFTGRIVGVSSPPVVEEALRLGVIDRAASLEEAVPEADLVYLAQPIRRILGTLPGLNDLLRPDALVTDAGSTKAEILDCAKRSVRRAIFLGGHPMAGKEIRGVSGADADLFRGRTYLLCPLQPEDMQDHRVAAFSKLLEGIGAQVHVLPAKAHDQLVALTSHLPQLISTALSSTLESALAGQDLAAAGPGLLDMTRLALSSFDIWSDILATNPDAIGAALDTYIGQLRQIRERLRTSAIADDFRRGAAFSGRLRHETGR